MAETEVYRHQLKAIHTEDWFYTLYAYNEHLILSVLCGSVGLYETNVYLPWDIQEAYQEKGLRVLTALAEKIRQSPNSYNMRRVQILD